MALWDRVPGIAVICEIYLDSTGSVVHADAEPAQLFHDSVVNLNDRTRIYFGRQSVNLAEKSEETRAGDLWTSEVSITFPNSDYRAIQRLEALRQVELLQIRMNYHRTFLFGRQGIDQNRKPKLKIERGLQLTRATFTNQSSHPMGFTQELGNGLPHIVPVS